MDKTLRIKLSIADRLYPMSVYPYQEEAFRRASKKIAEMIHNFEANYEIKDKRDALAMCAIVLAAEIEQSVLTENQQDTSIKERLNNIYNLINSIE